ncbi:MAG: hypothetical protein HBSAPP03_06150 [Phycisphaerae bacterium]|nr:MAG: hypothetical protein HBSAPP03_06150 [Phycisphaerae bacterium]
MFRSHLRRTTFLTLAAGLPGLAQADVFTFSGTCNVNWYQECQTSPCGGGGWNTFNNWSKTGCNWGLPVPGAGDVAVIGAAAVTLNGNATLGELQNAAGGVLTWSAGNLDIAVPFTNTGTVHIPGSHKALTGTLINNNYVLAWGDWQFNAANGAIINNALFEVSGTKQMYIPAGTGGFSNHGTFRKIDGGTLDFRWPLSNTGVMDTVNGTSLIQLTTITSGPASSWPVGGAGVVRLAACVISGLYAGSNAGVFQLESGTSIPSNTTLAMSGNGVNWASGTIDIAGGTLLTNTQSFFVPGGHKQLNGSFRNTGTVTAHGDWQFNLGGATVTNDNAWIISGTKQFYETGGVNLFTNNGTISKIEGGTADWRWPLVNPGQVSTTNGTLFVVNTSVQSGPASTWPVGANGEVRSSGCSLSGMFAGANAGLFQLESGTAIPANTTFAITGNGVNWASGTIAVAGGSLLTNTGSFWVPGGHKQLNGAFRNTGTVTTHSDWQFNLGGSTVTNDNLWVISGTKQFYEASGGNLFTNNATLRKTDGGTADWRWPLVNNALIDVANGTLYLVNTSVSSLGGSNWAIGAAGSVRLSGDTIQGTFAGANAGLFQIESGVAFTGNTLLNITGNGVNWASGTITVNPGHLLTNAGTFWIPGGHKQFVGAVRNTGSMIAHSDWQWNLAGASLTNDGQITISSTKQCYEAGGTNAFTNNGTLAKTDGSSVDFRWPTTNHGLIDVISGTLQLWGPFTQGALGTTRVNSTLNVGGGQTFAAGVLEGSGTIAGPVTSGAWVRPGGFNAPGVLTIAGTYTQNGDGILDVEIGGPTPGSEHDRLAITGNATLAGRIAVRFFNGLQPVAGSTYTVLTSNVRSGTFSQIIVLDPLDGLEVTIDYTSTSVIVRVVACTPCLPCDGDVNCDGAVNGLDVEIQELAVGGDLTDYCQPDADFNHDGTVNGVDVEGVEQVVGGGFCP